MPIMYVCEPCQENAPECCGYNDRKDIRVMPDGTWVCEFCFQENASDFDVRPLSEDGDMPIFSDFENPPEYKPAVA